MPPTNPPPTGAVTYSQQYRRCGKPDCQVCRPGLPGHGPYWYARWQEGGRTRTRYIGKEAPPDVSDRALPVAPTAPRTTPTPAVEDKDVGGQAQGGTVRRRTGAGKTAALSGLAQDQGRPFDVASAGTAAVGPLTVLPAHAGRQDADGPSRDVPLPRDPSGITLTPTLPPPALRVRTLGGFTVWHGDRELAPGRWSRRTVAALFKCLLTAPGQRLTREQAADLLWPDADRDQGSVNLRAAIHRLRAVLDEPGTATSYLRSEGSILLLDPHPGSPANQDQDWLDADAFARAARLALAGGDITTGQAALDLYGGAYLPDDPYEDWAAARREELRQQYHALLLQLARLSADAGDSAGAVWRLRLLLAADPCHEPATRLLMRLLAATGDRAEALRAYEVLVRALRDDLDVVPTPETESLHATLRAAVASPRTEPQTTPTNLPAALTSFVGRGRELAAVEHGLAQGPWGCRLLTLTGAGGGGKTRLALEVAAAVRPRYPDGAWLVELAALADPALVPATVAAALDLRELPDASFTEAMAALTDTLHSQRMLLVLDNCEHLVAACAELAARLLRACPQLQILATSREALGIAGETVWRLPPLSLPPLTEDVRQFPRVDAPPGGAAENVVVEAAALDRLQRFEAVQLFVERARASRPDFTLTGHNVAAVAQICRRLDGLPLAIELAAARLSALSARDVAARLDDRFRLLTTGNRAALPRHQTLRGVLDWSYTLLNAPEQALLRRLAVFAGGWTLEAAETVCAGEPVRECDVLDLLAGLEAKSLVTLVDDLAPPDPDQDGESRYGLLETVRQYAADHLAANGELDAAGAAHAAYILTLVERAEPGLYGPRQRYWLDRLDAEHDNIRAALTWSTREGEGADAQTAARLAKALEWFWRLRGHLHEGRRWLAIVLSKGCGDGDDASRLWAGALNAAGMLAERQHDYDPAEQALQESVARYRALGDDQGTADALNNLGHVAWDRSDYARAHALFQESLSLRRTLGDERGVASSLNNLARVHRYQGDVETATGLYEQSLAHWKRVGEPWGIATVLGNLGLEMGERRDYQRALSLHQESLALRRELGDKMGVSWSLTNVASIDIRLGNYERAVTLFEESLQLARQLGDKATVTDIVEGLAEVAQAREEMGRAARLFGGVGVLRAAVGDPLSPAERARYDRNVAAVHAALGEDRFTMRWREGQAMTLEETITYARKRGA